jgi:hypothetical protein
MSEVNLPQFPEFRELRIEDCEILQACLDRLPPETADQNFTSLLYVYLTEHLITLAGRSYHGQRNHIREFTRTYPDFSLELIGPDNIAECLELAEEWFAAKWRALSERPGSIPETLAYEQAFLMDERVAIKELFSHFQELHVTGLTAG